jgi:hypothetical protein
MKTMKLTFVTLASLLLLISLSWADKVEIPIGGAALIANETGQRVVIKLNLTGLPQKAVVDYAEVRFAQGLGVSTKDLFGVWVQALNKAWDAGSVSWTVPWTTPGGDFGSENVMAVVRPGVTEFEARLDVTRFVKAWRSGTANNGLILRRIPGEGDLFKVDGNALKTALSQAKLVVLYSPQ